MKKFKLYLSILGISLSLIACDNEQKEIATESVDYYQTYIDSITKVNFSQILSDWENVETQVERVRMNAQYSLEKISDSLDLQRNLNQITEKYKILKARIITEQQKILSNNEDYRMYRDLFGAQYVDDNLNLAWINNDNVLGVYQNFLYTCEETKSHYNAQNFKTIKFAFSALNARRNALISEGLDAKEVEKIANIESKFRKSCEGH